jgi:hypothetical protein
MEESVVSCASKAAAGAPDKQTSQRVEGAKDFGGRCPCGLDDNDTVVRLAGLEITLSQVARSIIDGMARDRWEIIVDGTATPVKPGLSSTAALYL